MAIVIPDGFVQATLNYDAPTRSGSAATVLGFAKPGDLDLVDIASQIWGAWEAHLKPVTHQAWTLRDVVAVTETSGGVSIGGPLTGSRTGELSPPNVTVLMKKSSAARGRATRGRTYWGGHLNDGDVYDDGSLAPTRRDTLLTAYTDFFDTISVDGINQVILHNTGAVAPTAVTSISVESKVATQRRRLR